MSIQHIERQTEKELGCVSVFGHWAIYFISLHQINLLKRDKKCFGKERIYTQGNLMIAIIYGEHLTCPGLRYNNLKLTGAKGHQA